MVQHGKVPFLLGGPCLLLLARCFLAGIFGVYGSLAMGIALWMIFWWITRPVALTVTALLPVVANAFFALAPMDQMLAQYASSSIVLLFAATLLTLPWERIGLDHRIALRCLAFIGPTMKSQITVWFLAAVLFSVVLPNAVVVAVFTPTALAMLKATGCEGKDPAAGPILCAIVFGAAVGGVGTPVGGAMDVIAANLYQQATGQEFLFTQWFLDFLPYLLLSAGCTLGVQLLLPEPVHQLQGTREYFLQECRRMGPLKRDEKICLGLFALALAGSFLRPLYAAALPGLLPAYLYGSLGFLLFFLEGEDGRPLLSWEYAQQHMIWGVLILFAGGLAMGNLLEASGANRSLAQWTASQAPSPGLPLIAGIVCLAAFLSEVSSITISAALMVPLVISYTQSAGLPLLPYWMAAVMGFNGAFLLPTGIRAIPCGAGLSSRDLFRRGLPGFAVRLLCAVGMGWLAGLG